MTDKYYYIIDLEVSLKGSKYVFGFINISHIPYSKFEELFKDQVTNEHFLFDDVHGYSIDKELYLKHKAFFDKEIPFDFDFNLFEYNVGLAGIKPEEYKPNYYTERPPNF